MKTRLEATGSRVKGENTGWVATFTLLDVSGAITASQWRRVTAPLKAAWRRATGWCLGRSD